MSNEAHPQKKRTIYIIAGMLLMIFVGMNVTLAYAEPSQQVANPGTTDLVSWWSLDEESGTRNDSHAANHMTDVNTVGYAAGKQGNAASFSAVNTESLYALDDPSISMGDVDFTIGGWVNLNALGGLRAFMGKGSTSGSNKDYEYFLEYDPGPNAFYFGIGNGVTYGEVTNTAPSTFTWYFLTAWYDSTADTMYLQVNNGSPASVTYTGGSFDSTYNLFLGRVGEYYGGFFDGSIDEAFIYKRILTDAERTWLYNSGNGRSYSDLLCLATDLEIQGITGVGGNDYIPFYGVAGTSHVWDPIVAYDGNYVNSVWIMNDENNIVELGWLEKGEYLGGERTYFRTWTVNGIYHDEFWGSPYIDTDHEFQLYNFNADQEWRFVVDDVQITPNIQMNFYYGLAGAMRERHNTCDSGTAHWWNLQRCDYACSWSLWQTIGTRFSDFGWHLDAVSPSEFYVNPQ